MKVPTLSAADKNINTRGDEIPNEVDGLLNSEHAHGDDSAIVEGHS